MGYSDGSIACASMPTPVPPSVRLRDFSGGGGSIESLNDANGAERHVGPVRRFRRIPSMGAGGGGGSSGGGAVMDAAITALCPLSTPVIVAGDSDGRLGLWTTSSALSSSARYSEP